MTIPAHLAHLVTTPRLEARRDTQAANPPEGWVLAQRATPAGAPRCDRCGHHAPMLFRPYGECDLRNFICRPCIEEA